MCPCSVTKFSFYGQNWAEVSKAEVNTMEYLREKSNIVMDVSFVIFTGTIDSPS